MAAAVVPDAGTTVVPPVGLARPRRARPPPPPGGPAPAGAPAHAEVGAGRLRSGVTFAVAGDPVAARDGRGASAAGRSRSPTSDRAAYHAAACIAANHVVALLGQVERVAASAGLALDAFLGLTRAALDDVAASGPRRPHRPAAPGRRGHPGPPPRRPARRGAPGYDAGVALAPAPGGAAAAVATGDLRAARRRRAERARAAAPRPVAAVAGRCRRPRDLDVLGPRRVLRPLDAERAAGRTVGLVPTMGALHAGHRSLIARAAAPSATSWR